jgi:hypothetical protein
VRKSHVNVPSKSNKRLEGHWRKEQDPDPLVRVRYGSANPDACKNVTDLEHCLLYVQKETILNAH